MWPRKPAAPPDISFWPNECPPVPQSTITSVSLGYRTASPPKLYPHVASSKLTQAHDSESRTAVCVAFCGLLILAAARPRSLRIIQALLVHSRLVIASWFRRGHRVSCDSYLAVFGGKAEQRLPNNRG